MTAKEILIIQHIAAERAGTIERYLEVNKMPFRYIKLHESEALPEKMDNIRAVVVMGGPMNVYQEKEFPFLVKENLFIKKIIEKGIPYFEICLGAQLLAKALGARVMKAKAPEIGWDRISLSEAGAQSPLFQGLGKSELKVLQWHQDTFDIPRSAVHLASSEAVPNQAFCFQNRFYGLQFHVEVTRPMLEEWFKPSGELEKILKEYDGYQKDLTAITEIIYKNFFKKSLSAARLFFN